MNKVWPYPGACWWKFDFHTHTPASTDTRAWQTAIGTPDELTPQVWLLKYMAAEIDCVAVTDHNTGGWIDTLKEAYAEMEREADAGTPPVGFRQLHLFPGVEISVQSGFHLLAIFDQSASSDTISNLLATVEYQGTHGDSDGVTRKGVAEVVARVLDAGGLAIPAHVDGEKGLLQVKPGTRSCVMDTNTVRQVLQEDGILALEWKASTSPEPAVVNELKLRFASVVGSDCHNFRGPAVPGSRFTWIKMASPSMEGLRLALLDGQEVSVRRYDENIGFEPLKTPEHFIEAIEICDARYMGHDSQHTKLSLSPYFNALIGGRGTGKSTIVHALRLAYRRANELSAISEAGQTFSRFVKVSKSRTDEGGLTATTTITAQVQRDGMPYRLIWRQDGQGHTVEELDTATDSFEPSSSRAITTQRFPVRMFSQGQIAELAGDSQQALLKVIDDAANTQAQQASFDEAKRAFLIAQAQIRDLKGKLQGHETLKLALQDVQRKLDRFEDADHAAVLKNYQRTSRQSRELDRQFEGSAELVMRFKAVASDLLAEDLPDGLFDTTGDHPALHVIRALHAAGTKARQEVESAATALRERSLVLRGELEASPWFAQISVAKATYEQLKADLLEQDVRDPREYGRLVQEKLQLENELKKLEALQRQYIDLRGQAKSLMDEVQSTRCAISAQRSSFLQAELQNNHYVRIALIPYSLDGQAMDRSLREVLGVTDSRFVEDLYHEQEGEPSKGLLADLLGEVGPVGQSGKRDTAAFEQALLLQKKRLWRAGHGQAEFGGRFNKFLKGEAEKRPELMDHVLCWFPEDGLQVEYSRKGDGLDFQSIRQASAGQRAAAMLAFLLAHGNEPLVLDQPEDDLDNHLIYGLVVQQIRSNKLRRQLIIVTHNPNIVVNGDAELIHVLDFVKGQCCVTQTGSLQDQTMRREVCQVMEGGEEAFERRYQRLGKVV